MPSLQDLLTEPEGKTIEFKRDLSSPIPALRSLIAFANSAGGHLIFGKEDDGRLVGIADPVELEDRLANMIYDSISPRLVPSIEIFSKDSQTFLAVQVYPSGSRPHWLNKEGEAQGVYVRLGASNRRADEFLIQSLKRSITPQHFDEEVCFEADYADFSKEVIQKHEKQMGKALGESELKTLKCLTVHQGQVLPTQGGVLLLHANHEAFFPEAWIQCGRFRGCDRVEIFDQREFHGPLPELVEQAMGFLEKHAHKSALIDGLQRKDVWSIPVSALREALVNAVVHGDYTQRGSPLRVMFYDDRIEIENPGLLLPGVTIEDLLRGYSKLRNPVIARYFKELGYMEQWGSGIPRLIQQTQAEGFACPVIQEIVDRIRFTFPLIGDRALDANSGLDPINSGLNSSLDPINSGLEPNTSSLVPNNSSLVPNNSSLVPNNSRLDLKDRILKLLVFAPLSRGELAKQLGHGSVSGAINKAITDLFESGRIEFTLPDKPNSRNQKIRLAQPTNPTPIPPIILLNLVNPVNPV